jgi:hypothetical protein
LFWFSNKFLVPFFPNSTHKTKFGIANRCDQ